MNALSPAKIVRIEPLLDQGPLGNRLRSFRPAFARDRQGWAERPPSRRALTGWKIDIKVKDEEKLPTMKDLFMDFSEMMSEEGK